MKKNTKKPDIKSPKNRESKHHPKPQNISPEAQQKMLKQAIQAMKNAHAPYSGFQVGASVLTQSGRIFSGCNVENASYGGTICAERTAVVSAVAHGEKELVAVLVVTNAKTPWPPCGFCRQVLAEFLPGEAPIFIANTKKIVRTSTLQELLPDCFSGKNLK